MKIDELITEYLNTEVLYKKTPQKWGVNYEFTLRQVFLLQGLNP